MNYRAPEELSIRLPNDTQSYKILTYVLQVISERLHIWNKILSESSIKDLLSCIDISLTFFQTSEVSVIRCRANTHSLFFLRVFGALSNSAREGFKEQGKIAKCYFLEGKQPSNGFQV